MRYVLSTKFATLNDEPAFDHPWLFDRCREVQKNPNWYIDIWAREHFKTTIISYGLTIFDILRNPETTIGIFSHSRPLAKRILIQIKQEFQDNDFLKELFPDVLYEDPKNQSPKWSENEGIVVKRETNPSASTVEAWGLVDGQPIGKHFQTLVYDDVVTEESVYTEDSMNKILKMWELSVNLGTDTGVQRYIGTRYHYNDLYHEIIDRGVVTPRVYPAWDPPDHKEGTPVLQNQEYLERKWKSMSTFTAAAQLLCDPKAGDELGFHPDWLRFYEESPTRIAEGANKIILVDPASEKKKNSDFTSVWVVALRADNNFYVVDGVRKRMNLQERTNLLFHLHKKWRPLEVRYEKYSMQADIQHIEYVQKIRNYRFEITPVAGNIRKEDRIRRLIPIFQSSRMYLPKYLYCEDSNGEMENLTEVFISKEYKAFPVGMHDDMLDALSRIAEPDLELIWPKAQDYLSRAMGDPWREELYKSNTSSYSWAGA